MCQISNLKTATAVALRVMERNTDTVSASASVKLEESVQDIISTLRVVKQAREACAEVAREAVEAHGLLTTLSVPTVNHLGETLSISARVAILSEMICEV